MSNDGFEARLTAETDQFFAVLRDLTQAQRLGLIDDVLHRLHHIGQALGEHGFTNVGIRLIQLAELAGAALEEEARDHSQTARVLEELLRSHERVHGTTGEDQ